MLSVAGEPVDRTVCSQHERDGCETSIRLGRLTGSFPSAGCLPGTGGYPKFVQQGFNSNFLPVWLQQAGYDTYYTGKLFNAHTVDNYNSPHVAGFNGSDFLLDPYTYSYLNATYQRNHDPPVSYEGRHTADVLAEKAFGFLEDAIAGERPFFLGIAPVSPHSNLEPDQHISPDESWHGSIKMTAPIPAERHKHLFQDVKVPRTAHFNPDTVGDGVLL